MQIFFSHSSKQKPLIREIKSHLPEYLGVWIDEEKLLFGDNLTTSIEAAIKADSDYVLLFIDHHAAASNWIAKELDWTLQAEKTHERLILLPILIDEEALQKLNNLEIQNRKYLRIRDFMESSVRSLAASISSELFALVCRDMERLRNPKPKRASTTIADAETLLRTQAVLIQKAVFPHRKSNPISLETLREIIFSQTNTPLELDELESILSSIVRRNLIPGLVYDGFSLFLFEEHASWKAEIQHQKKEKVGRKALGFIHNGMKIILDAGSTIEEIVRPLCKKIESHALTKITIATTSINIADMISDCCVSMGFDDEYSAVRLYVPGGKIRPSTQAIVPNERTDRGQLQMLADYLGGFDLGIVGVNGVDATAGFTTNDNAEALNKLDIIRASASRIVVGDSSKIGIILDCKFADFDEDLTLVLDDDQRAHNLRDTLGPRTSQIVLA